MITRKEYNDALDIVEEYHKQIFINKINENTRNLAKTKWNKWILNKKCSIRLKNVILKHPDFYLEDMTSNEFKRLRYAGIKSWNEFDKLRSEWLKDKQNYKIA